jgi:hypothetical protein
MRPSNDDSKYNISTNIKDGKVQVVVNALDAEDRFVNNLDMNATAVSPDLKASVITMRQQAPGRYVGEMTPEQAGSYMLTIAPGSGKPPITTGITVPFSDEYRVRQANMKLLESLAASRPAGGSKGEISEALESESIASILKADPYRADLPPAKSLTDIWATAVLLGAVLFFADVFVRRVAVDLGLPLRLLAQRFRAQRDKTDAIDAERKNRLERLRNSKTTVSGDLDKQLANTQFESELDQNASSSAASDAFQAGDRKQNTRDESASKKPSMGVEQEQSYTSRLLEAKRKANKQN